MVLFIYTYFTIHGTIHLTYFTIHVYVFYYSLIRILLFTYIFAIHYSLFTIYHLLFTINYLLFTIIYLLFTINYLLLTIYYLGENPYLKEFDQTPIFWCPCVARDAWINLTFCSDQF